MMSLRSPQLRRAVPAVIGRRAIAAVAAAAVGLALGLGVGPAFAAQAASAGPALPAACTQSVATVTCTYTAAGEHQFAVPTAVTSVTATAVGGQGGEDFGGGNAGGLGAIATGTLSVTPGQVIFAEVGILGGAAGSLVPGFADSGAGGGESDVRTCPTSGGQPCPAGSTLASRLLVAGGGGGSGEFGGPAGKAGTPTPGGDGSSGVGGRDNGGGGDGATMTAPGTGGAGCDGGGDGSPGAAAGGAGGNAGPANGEDGVSGGGGGAGWFGGGAGGGCSHPNDSAGSGGGGSSHAASSVTGVSFSQAASGQAASVIITYTVLTITTTSLPAGSLGEGYSTNLAAAGGTAPLTWSLANGTSLPNGLSLSSDGTISGTPQAAGVGDFDVQVSDSSSPEQTATQSLAIDVAQATPTVSLSASPSSGATIASPVTLTANVAGAKGAPAATGTVDFTANGNAVCTGVTVTGGTSTCSAGTLPAGSYTFNASYSGDSNYTSASGSIANYDIPQVTPGLSLTPTPSVNATVATPVSLSATVVPLAGGPAPTGTVTFLVNGTAPAGCTNVNLSGDSASCSVGTLPAGNYTLVATYSGDTNYLSTSATNANYQISKLTSSVTVTPSVTAPVWGQAVSFTATVTVAGALVTSGTVQWSVGGSPVGAPVAVGADGTASLGPLTNLAVGSDQVTADYSGTDQNAAATGMDNLVVGQAATTTAIAVTGKRLTATVTAVTPGVGVPSGVVTFAINGTTAGTANLSARGVAVLSVKSSGAEVASASYGGSTDFMPSTASTSTKNPAITAKVSSAHPMTTFGWYRSSVTVTFTCTAGSAPLTGPCPAAVTLSHQGAAQMVSRTIHAKDGGLATVVVSPINIDETVPKVSVTGAKAGAAVDAPGPVQLTCVASDSLSGLAAPCKLVISHTETAEAWTATATDKAGNTRTVTGRVNLLDYFVAGATRTSGEFSVTVGKTYTVEAYILGTNTAPKYVFAAPDGQAPHPVGPKMTSIGPHLWAIRIQITAQMDKRYQHWTLGVLSGATLHRILIILKK